MLYIIYHILYALHIILLSVTKICVTLCHSTNYSTPGSSVLHYLLQLLKLLSSWWCYLNMSSSHLPISYLFACPWGSPGKNPAVGCHFLLQWTIFSQNSSLWSVHLGCSCMAWLKASLSYANLFAMTRLWSMKGINNVNDG